MFYFTLDVKLEFNYPVYVTSSQNAQRRVPSVSQFAYSYMTLKSKCKLSCLNIQFSKYWKESRHRILSFSTIISTWNLNMTVNYFVWVPSSLNVQGGIPFASLFEYSLQYHSFIFCETSLKYLQCLKGIV